MDLNDALEVIVSSKKIGQWMTVVDHYLRDPVGARDAEAIPEAHRLILPILEKCRRNQQAFLELLRALRTSHPGAKDKVLSSLLQRVHERVTEEHKRRRARRAASRLIRQRTSRHTGPLTARQVEPAARQIEQAWNAALLQTMRAMCQIHPRHELSLEEVTQLTTEFWGFVEDEIERGPVPLWGADIHLGED